MSLALGAVALVLAGVWAVARQGERLARPRESSDPALRRLGLALIAVAAVNIGYALLVLVVDRDVGRCLWHVLGGSALLVIGRDLRRRESAPA